MPHGYCYLWRPELVGLHLLSDALIAVAYYSIPLTLFYFVRRRQDLPFNWVFLLFSAFILACGTTHLMAVWTLWHPTYWLSGGLKFITAAISVMTAVLLVPIVPKALALPSPAQLEAANQALQAEISDRKQTEAALQASEARFQIIIKNIPGMLYRYLPGKDGAGAFTYVSSGCGELLELEADRLLQDANRLWSLIHPEDFSSLQASVAIAIQNCADWYWEGRCTTPSGQLKWIQGHSRPEPTPEGVVWDGLFIDITDRKQSELALSHLAAIVESSGDAIIGKSLDGIITSWNAGAEKLFGYAAADVIDRPIALLFPPDHAAELPDVLERIKQGETIERYETVRVRQDGQRLNIAATISPIKNATGQVIGAAKIARDITAPKRVEAALRQSEERFQAFMNNSPAASWITDAEGRILYLNQTYSRLVQIPTEAIGKTVFELFAPEIAETFYRNIRQVIETQQTVAALEPVPRPDGAIDNFLVYKFPIDELSGQCSVGGIAIDITEREQAKEQLRSLNDRLQYLLNHAPVVIFSCKTDGDFGATSVSNNIKALFGHESQAFLEDSGFWAAHIHPEDRDRILANTSQIFITGHHAHEYRFRHGDGAYRWVYNQLQLMRDDAGIPTEIIGYLIDINKRKQTEAALRQSEARNRALIQAIPDLLIRMKQDGTYLDIQATGIVLLLNANQVAIGNNIHTILPTHIAQERMGYVQQALQTRELQVYEYQLRIDGKLRFEEARIMPCGEAEVLVIVRDISDRKQAEVELELQSLIVRNIAEGVCMVKVAEGTIVYANPKFERMFGYNADELMGQHIAIVNYDDRNTNTTAIFETLARAILAQGEATYEVYNVKKDGTPFWCQATTSVFEHPDYGAVFVVVQQDITERKRSEAMIQASLAEKDVLLKEIHHRVKNNLGVIDGLLQMQSRRSHNADVIETLQESQNRIASIALVHEKLYSSNNLAKIDFARYIADLTAHLFDSYNIHANQIKLTTHIAAISLNIDTAIPCGLIINELISNALKYAFSSIQTGEIQVTLQQQHDHNQNLTLIVRDNGIGLPQDFNLKQTKTLGMTLVKGLVKQLKGTLEVQTQPGTAFIISLSRV